MFGSSGGFNQPPTKATAEASDPTGRAVVVIGQFGNPARSPLRWRDIGSGMSDALARRILNQGEFDVWMNAPLAQQVESVLIQSVEDRRQALEQIRLVHGDVRFVITGRVTDFTHTAEVPEVARRRGMFGGRKEEALAAIQLNVIDLERGRIVASDHVYGTAKAPETPTKELYADIAFGSYVFWNMPLGEASATAVENAAEVLARLAPTDDDPIRISKQTAARRLLIVGGDKQSLATGREYYICVADEATGGFRAIKDPDSYFPLRARIDEPGRQSSTAWLMGRKPAEVDLRGAVLREELPLPKLAQAEEAIEPE